MVCKIYVNFFGCSYPFCEDINLPQVYLNTRAPAWCDRVLMDKIAWQLLHDETVKYDIVGKETCMGDHKVRHVRLNGFYCIICWFALKNA
ncbi:unnamed protein product [Soboliphyme baturini]|uniref:ULP_PROTEASE domain-containing protein n=1 Tax=Soboliphyme baturini TaxID=241478 RepID=A0A183IMV7_9BILA|nr:unnamed protein product [Soboliphyme baturini]